MPRGQGKNKGKKKPEQNLSPSDDERSRNMVANVNKLEQKKGKGKIKRRNEPNISGNKRLRLSEAPAEQIVANPDETEASFIEGSQMIEMSVRADEEREFLDRNGRDTDTEDEERANVESNMEPSEAESDGEIVEEADEEVTLANTSATRQNDPESIEVGFSNGCNKNKNGKSMRETRKQIEKIDQEMLLKISEIHELMVGGGLTESAAMLEKCAASVKSKMNESTSSPGRREGRNSNYNACEVFELNADMAALRTNNKRIQSKSKNRVQLVNADPSKSEETIYESVIHKHGSSSSEDEMRFNSSDELDKQVDDLILECRDRTMNL